MRPLPPLPLLVIRFTGIQSYSYTDQRKVEADVEVTENRTGDLSLRKLLSHDCCYYYYYYVKAFANEVESSHVNNGNPTEDEEWMECQECNWFVFDGN